MVSPPEGDDRNTVEILDTERPLFRERWRALSRRGRVLVTASACAIVLTGALGYVVATRPPPPPPDPVAATSIRITDVHIPDGTSDFDVTLRAAATSPVTFVGTSEGYGNLVLYVSPVPGTSLTAGEAATLHARAIVCTCHSPLPPRGTPLLFVTLRNDHGQGRAQVVPTAAQFDSIGRAVRQACAN
ncbi:hypothetical protein [Streptomyces sp. NPDC057257]|uniref:hypothetical protein n=1 Tax=Streptomyces sp. NPDC057257 TaxID=3346071 RepID=UPI00363CF262